MRDATQNVSGHALQEKTAGLSGMPGAQRSSRSSGCERTIFRHARTASVRCSGSELRATPVGVNLGLFDGGVRFINPIKGAREPDSWRGCLSGRPAQELSAG